MRCRDCPYGIEDFTLRTEMYKSVYGEYPDEDRTNESEQFVWCDKVGGKVYSFGHCSDWYEHDEEKHKNHSKKKRINKRERYLKHQNHLKYLYGFLNEYLINRPGRFHFHFRFEYPTADEVKDYLRDKLDEEYHSEINKVASFSRKTKLNYDCLSAIALELNEGETFEDAIKDLNIVNTSERENRYNIKLFTEEGIIFTADNETLDLFSGENNGLWVDDVAGNSICLKFKGNSVVFDNKTNMFSVSNDKINVTYDDDYLDDDVKDMYKKLHYTYAEIALNYGNRIHYNLV